MGLAVAGLAADHQQAPVGAVLEKSPAPTLDVIGQLLDHVRPGSEAQPKPLDPIQALLKPLTYAELIAEFEAEMAEG